MALEISVLGIRVWGGQRGTVSREESILNAQLGYFENHTNSIKKLALHLTTTETLQYVVSISC